MAELKPCPFCGKNVPNVGTIADHEFTCEDDMSYEYDSTHFDVVCAATAGGCGASTGKRYETPEEAIEAWNRRAGADNG